MTATTPTLAGDYVVETPGLSKRFGDRVAVDNVDLRIPRGVAFGYLGPNGAGKTTLIRMLLGLTPASSGTMTSSAGLCPEQRAEALARVGAIVEEPRFHRYLTRPREPRDRRRGPRARGPPPHRGRARPRRPQRPGRGEGGRYSLGMRQRLGVARSLLGDPSC